MQENISRNESEKNEDGKSTVEEGQEDIKSKRAEKKEKSVASGWAAAVARLFKSCFGRRRDV